MVFITAGMGGGTGTGAAPVIARAARDMGILTVGVVTKPFQFEGVRRMRIAEAGITELQQAVDTLIVIPNQNLFRVANEKTTFADAFAMADQVLYSGVACITDLMVKEGLINLDFADVRAIMREMGKAMMGTGEASGEKRAIRAAEAAIANPLLDDVSMKGARGLLISITGGNDLTLYEVDEAATPHPRGSRPGRQHHPRRHLRREPRRHHARLRRRDRHRPGAARARAGARSQTEQRIAEVARAPARRGARRAPPQPVRRSAPTVPAERRPSSRAGVRRRSRPCRGSRSQAKRSRCAAGRSSRRRRADAGAAEARPAASEPAPPPAPAQRGRAGSRPVHPAGSRSGRSCARRACRASTNCRMPAQDQIRAQPRATPTRRPGARSA